MRIAKSKVLITVVEATDAVQNAVQAYKLFSEEKKLIGSIALGQKLSI